MSSIISTIPYYVFANSQALNQLLDEAEKTPDWKLWAHAAFVQRDSSRPDHVFNKRWEKFEKSPPQNEKDEPFNVLKAIRLVAEDYLVISNGRLYIRNQEEDDENKLFEYPSESDSCYRKSSHFDRWQNIRARMTTWPFKLYMLYRHHRPEDFFLAHPNEPIVADFIRTEGLNETHLHLNGCLYPEEEWLHDLYDIPKFLECEEYAYNKKDSIRKHYVNVNSRLTPILAAKRLKLAATIRDTILQLEQGTASSVTALIECTRHEIRHHAHLPHLFSAPTRGVRISPHLKTRKEQEMQMWTQAFRLLEQESSFPYKKELQFFLHLYLLLENEHISLNCHTERRKGFDAFDAANDHTKLSVGTPTYYKNTFLRLLKAAEANSRNIVEVRVIPQKLRQHKDFYVNAYEQACRQWELEQKEELRMQREIPPPSIRRPQLVLVAHMIKKPPTAPPAEIALLLPPLFESERREHMEEAAQLAEDATYLMAQYRIPVALDAANSELHQEPEVFAPAYRLFERTCGITHKTYHCGEDFLHLISGIRAVYEAITFLKLENGNRIGHGISVGIPPKVWAESMPAKLVLSMREWFLDTIFIWKVLHQVSPEFAEKAEREAVRMARLLFASKHDSDLPVHDISIHLLCDFFDLRQFDPSDIRRFLDGRLSLNEYQAAEHNLLKERKEQFGNQPFYLCRQWNYEKECRDEQEKLIEVDRDFLPIPELLKLQQRIQHLIAAREVVIETLPVSNLRISQYRRIQEHHVLRWLKVPGHAIEGDADMNICIGSDDPGVFATDIKNEYYHLYMCLRNAGVPAHEAVEKLRRVNNAGRIYAFLKLPDMEPTTFRLISLLNKRPYPRTLSERFRRHQEQRDKESTIPHGSDL